jgi:signal transduction histidine kinase
MQSTPVRRTKGTTAPRDEQEAGRLLQAQIRRLEEQFSKLKEQVRHTQQLASLGTAAAMMAHEYNNAMTPVVGYARYASESGDPELMKKALAMTLRQASVVSAMSDRILGLAVNEAQSLDPVMLKPLVEDAVASMCRDPAKDGITLQVNIGDDVAVLGDDRQLRQVFFNLLLNARQAINSHHGRITIDAAPASDDSVNIHVTDNGCGIKPEHVGSIFEPFFTTKSASGNTPRKGCGLGLALCHDIITEHNGQITVQSQPGRGTTFTITLPAAVILTG